MSEAAASAPRAVEVLAAWDETPAFRGLRVDLGPLGDAHRRAGQVLQVHAGDKDAYFAIASRPGRPVELLVKRGHGGDAVIAQADAGQLAVRGVVGGGFPHEEMRGRDVLLFAAGSGIAPVRALVEEILTIRNDVGRVALWYGQHHEQEFAYRGEQADWTRAGVGVHLCCAEPSPGWSGPAGRVQDVAARMHLDGIHPDGAVAYLCGMKGMIAGTRQMLEARGILLERTFLNF